MLNRTLNYSLIKYIIINGFQTNNHKAAITINTNILNLSEKEEINLKLKCIQSRNYKIASRLQAFMHTALQFVLHEEPVLTFTSNASGKH